MSKSNEKILGDPYDMNDPNFNADMFLQKTFKVNDQL